MNQDQQFEKYLQGQSELSQAYHEMPDEKLPDHLDAAILAEAHRAVGARPGGIKKRQWYTPLSLVATLFVIVMAGLMLPDMLKDADVTRQLQEAAPVASAPVTKEDAIATGRLAEKALPESTGQVRAESKPAVPVQAEHKAKSMQAQDSSRDSRVVTAKKTASVADVVNEPAPAVMMAAPAPAAEKPVFARGQKYEESTGKEMMLEKRILADTEARNDKAARKSMAAPAAPMVKEYESQQSGLVAAGEVVLSPEDWIKRIRKLIQENRMDEAKKELAAFRKKYPDFELPRDLILP